MTGGQRARKETRRGKAGDSGLLKDFGPYLKSNGSHWRGFCRVSDPMAVLQSSWNLIRE